MSFINILILWFCESVKIAFVYKTKAIKQNDVLLRKRYRGIGGA
jgi:hypothetical protein